MNPNNLRKMPIKVQPYRHQQRAYEFTLGLFGLLRLCQLTGGFLGNDETSAVEQVATAGMGITLTAASTMIFYSMDYSMSNYEQCRARIHRAGQKYPCTYIHLIAKGTVDVKVMQALRTKVNLAKSLVDDWRRGINPFQ